MLIMPLIPEQVDALDQGNAVPVRINGEDVHLAREGKYLCYKDQGGVLNRCLILAIHKQTDGLTIFSCASDGDEDEPHTLIYPERSK